MCSVIESLLTYTTLSKTTLYEDDSCLFGSDNIPNLIERRLQVGINNISWTHRTGFKFSPSKTVSMFKCRGRRYTKMANNLTIDK